MTARLRRFLHFVAADVLHYTGLLDVWMWLRWQLGRGDVCVLGLHRVLTEQEQSRTNSLDAMALRESTFDSILEHVQRNFEVVSLEAFLEGRTDTTGRYKPRCLLTFDDGWEDTRTRAFPCLRKHGMPATVFLTTGMIGTRGGFWVEQVARAWRNTSARQKIAGRLGAAATDTAEDVVERLKHMSAVDRQALLDSVIPPGAAASRNGADAMLTWEQVLEMSRGGMEFGTHTVTHPLLTYEDDAAVERELRAGKQVLEAKLQRKIRAFAYPNGDWDARVRGWVERTGYTCAFTTQGGWHKPASDPYTIRRILIHEGNVTGRDGRFSPAMFHLTLAGWH